MYEVKTMNKIAQQGLDLLAKHGLVVNNAAENPDGMLIRSAKLHDMEFGDRLLAIARAGVGTDNVPIARCTEQGIAVFNAAGANAQAVKELALCALFLCSRDIAGGMRWVREHANDPDLAAEVETHKSAFVGPEINGKTLGIIGLGAIGSLVANSAITLGMNVLGYDPFMSVDAAWRLRSEVTHVENIEQIYRQSDYLMVQVHCNEKTWHMIDANALAMVKPGIRILNFARGELVDDDAMIAALDRGQVTTYVTDFPNNKLVKIPNVVSIPHLGASTPESEDKCAIMAAEELAVYLKTGNIRNSVNLPEIALDRMGAARLCVIHANKPRMITRFLDLIGGKDINVEHMINKPLGEIAYTIIDTAVVLDDDIIESIRSMPDVRRVRVII